MLPLWRRVAGVFRRNRAARELEEEMAGHRDLLRQQLEDGGHSPAEAARLAAVRFGGAAQIRERSVDQWRFATIEGFGRDARLAARALARRPGFAAAAIATLALGIGASTAIFSVAYGVSFRPLPYADPSRLVRLYEANPADGDVAQNVSAATFHEWRTNAPSIESAAMFARPRSTPLAGDVDQAPLRIMSVSPAFFDVLGVRPILGTTFPAESTYTRYNTTDIILSHAAWQRFFGDRQTVDGATVDFAGIRESTRFRVLGVMPDDFEFDEKLDGWTPEIVELPVARIIRGWRYDRVIARLKPGATLAQATAEIATVSARLGHDFPKTNAGWTATAQPLRDVVAGTFGRATGLLLAAVAVVLVVACFNVGGLLMARAVARDRETAIRVALGAGSGHLLRLWFAESTILGISGATLGLLVAYLGVTALKAAAPPGIPRLDAISLDGPALAVALTALLVAIGICTAVLARRSSTRQSIDRWRSGPAEVGDDRRGRRLRAMLLVAQCAGAATLVVLGAMLTRSFANLVSSNLGWRPEGALSMSVAPPMSGRRPWFQYVQWSDELIASLEQTPGIRGAAITTQIPLSGSVFTEVLASGRGKSTDDGRRWPVIPHHVTDGYFDVVGMRLVEGRRFDVRDRFTEKQMTAEEVADRASEGVAIVTQSVARALWPGQSAIGQSLWLPDIDNIPRDVVGVVEDVQFRAVGEEAALHVFTPWTESSTGAPRLIVRTTGDATKIVPAVRAVLQSVSSGTRVDQIVTLDDLYSRTTAQPRFTSRIVALFGAAALLLAAVGIYGTQWYIVGVRTRELGLRLALGASRGGIVSHVLWGGLTPAMSGGLIGLGIAAGLGRAFRSLFFGMATVDVVSLAAGAAVLTLAAATAALGPAVKASRVDPMIALRSE
jgi:putative ABC transport system permease protein